jgi:HTH-type transcriptional regulator/antitoxin HigA
MEKVINSIGLSRDLIIHPGETLIEVLEDRNMSQRELAIRTGVTEKHVSTVIHGQKNISPAFAKRLEYALGIEVGFWMNLQANYDREILEYEELNGVTTAEMAVLDSLKAEIGGNTVKDPAAMVIAARHIMRISNLLDLAKVRKA